MFNALIKAQEELRNQGKDEWNISALSNLTGVSRLIIRKLRNNGPALIKNRIQNYVYPFTKTAARSTTNKPYFTTYGD